MGFRFLVTLTCLVFASVNGLVLSAQLSPTTLASSQARACPSVMLAKKMGKVCDRNFCSH